MPRVRRYVTLYEQLSCGSTGYASVSNNDIEVSGRTVEARGPRKWHWFTMITPGPAATASRLSSDHCTAAGYSGRPRVSSTSLAAAVMALTRCHCVVARTLTSWVCVVMQGCATVARLGRPGCRRSRAHITDTGVTSVRRLVQRQARSALRAPALIPVSPLYVYTCVHALRMQGACFML